MLFSPAQHSPPNAPPPGPRRSIFEAIYADPLPWLITLAVAHVAIRVAISSALKWDEAQQILWTQHLQWGYGAQPPLYTWMQWVINQALGPSVLALSLLKHTLIVAACIFMWLAGRELLGRRGAWWSAASLMLLPPFGWYSIRDQTHTVLVTVCVCATWWLLLRIVRREGRGCMREFIALGLACGCGLIAKYSFALALAALAVGFLSVPGPRRALFGRGWWWTVLITIVIAAPHGWWMLSHWHAASAGTLQEMEIAPEHHWGKGLLDMLSSAPGTLGVWALLALAAFGSGWWRRGRPTESAQPAAPDLPAWPAAWLRAVFWRYLAVIALALLGMVFVADVTMFKSRWVLPLLAPVPLMAFALRPELEDHPRGRWFTGATLALVLVMLVAAGARPWFAYVDGGTDELNHPAAQLAQTLRNAGYDGKGRIIAADHMLAGTLRSRFPAAEADACSHEAGNVSDCVAINAQQAQSAGRGWLLISRADRVEPGWWQQALAGIANGENLPRGNLRLPFRMVRRDHPLASYDFVWHPAPGPSSP